jgi:replicative DNA helicase
VDLAAAVGKSYDRLDSRMCKGGGIQGLKTGLVDLDHLTAGLQDSELTIAAARPGVGKTAFALAIARKAIQNGHAVHFASLEQAEVELADRLICAEAGLDGHKLRAGTFSRAEIAIFKEAGDRLASLPLFIDDDSVQSMFRITAKARRHKLRHGIRLVIVDYLQLVEPENRREPRHEQVAGVSRRLKQLARDLALPVLALAQLNRASELRADQEPRLADLRESGAIEADADTVMLMHSPHVRKDGQEGPNDSSATVAIEVHVAKQRNGPTGRVTLAFRKEYQRFENYAVDR